MRTYIKSHRPEDNPDYPYTITHFHKAFESLDSLGLSLTQIELFCQDFALTNESRQALSDDAVVAQVHTLDDYNIREVTDTAEPDNDDSDIFFGVNLIVKPRVSFKNGVKTIHYR